VLGAAPVAALSPGEVGDAFTHLAPHVDAAAALAVQRLADLSDVAMAADFASSASASIDGSSSAFADALQAVNGVSTSDAAAAVGDVVSTGPQRMEGILSPVSDRLEEFVLGAQALFKEQGVPYPLGSAIIFTTLTVKALTYPFTKTQIESSLNLQNLQPQVDAVRKKYENDTERMNVEINRLYDDNQVSPLAGCVPILLTLPVVWGLYRAFNNASIDGSFNEPWFFIPSLAGPSADRSLDWLLPLDANYNPPIGWHDATLYLIVPLLTVASQYVSMNILKPPKDENDPKVGPWGRDLADVPWD
jgi:YidC/Oxa1 family membrane protein insertase